MCQPKFIVYAVFFKSKINKNIKHIKHEEEKGGQLL